MRLTLRGAGLSFGAVMLAALAGAAQAGSTADDEWETKPFDANDGCYSARVLDSGVMLGFHQMVKKKEFRLTLSSPEWEDQVPEEDTGQVAVTVQTRKGKRQIATKEGYAIHAGDLEAIAGIWYDGDGKAARKALAAGTEMDVTYQGRSLGSFSLKDADKAVDALERCVADLGKG